jgi:hypothetical protein
VPRGRTAGVGKPMKAISLWQPHATLIALNEKRCETRPRRTSYRGEIAIHAAQRWTAEQAHLLDTEPFKTRLARHGITRSNAVHDNMPRGAIVCVADLIDDIPVERFGPCPDWQPALFEIAFGNYSPRRRGFLLTNIRRLRRPVECRGYQAIPFDVPPYIARLVRIELEGVIPVVTT